MSLKIRPAAARPAAQPAISSARILFSGQQMPEITDAYAESVSARYIELYEQITGKPFERCVTDDDLALRIEKNVNDYLATLKK